jgi:hypothetical protein
MSYDKSSGEILGYRHTGFSVKTASREYSGELYGIKVDDKITWTTPEHRFAVRFKTGSQNIWCTYLMKRGCLWRVGMCRIFNQLGYGLKIRLKQEKAEAAWILETHKGYKDASSAEHATAIKYGIPMTCWEPERGMLRKSERWRDKEHIEDIYLRLDLNEMEANAHRLLKDYHRLYEYPALTRAACGHKFSRRITTLVSACNLIPRIMELPIPYKHWDTPRCKTFDWETIDKVLHKEYEGLVYSLDVEKYHFYIADGIVTHNCLYGWKPGAAHRWFSDRCQSNIMEFNKPSRSEEHPSMKPVDMLIYLIKNSSSKDDIVVDLFGGSGSTLIAAEQTGRKAYLMELDEKYSDVIRKRWAEFVHGEGCAWEELTKPLTEVENE